MIQITCAFCFKNKPLYYEENSKGGFQVCMWCESCKPAKVENSLFAKRKRKIQEKRPK